MTTLPCLSIRQPWAWAILNAGKDVENRTWSTNYRGPLLIHAAKGCTRDEYEDAVDSIDAATFAWSDATIDVPGLSELPRGGIVGCARVTDIYGPDNRRSIWHNPGCYAWKLECVTPLAFRGLRGALGLFIVELVPSEVMALSHAGLLANVEVIENG